MTTQNYEQMIDHLLLVIHDYMLLCIAFIVFMVIVKWKILNKAGQGGWKQFIPIYNIYIEYKLYWETSFFWLLLASPFMLDILITRYNVNASELLVTIQVILMIFIVFVCIFSPVILQFKKAKSFGQSFWFGLGLLLMNPIFQIAIAFDKNCIYRKYNGYEFINYHN